MLIEENAYCETGRPLESSGLPTVLTVLGDHQSPQRHRGAVVEKP